VLQTDRDGQTNGQAIAYNALSISYAVARWK